MELLAWLEEVIEKKCISRLSIGGREGGRRGRVIPIVVEQGKTYREGAYWLRRPLIYLTPVLLWMM